MLKFGNYGEYLNKYLWYTRSCIVIVAENPHCAFWGNLKAAEDCLSFCRYGLNCNKQRHEFCSFLYREAYAENRDGWNNSRKVLCPHIQEKNNLHQSISLSVFGTLFELHTDVVALVSDAGVSGIDGYAPVSLNIVFLFLCLISVLPFSSLYNQLREAFQCATVFAKLV